MQATPDQLDKIHGVLSKMELDPPQSPSSAVTAIVPYTPPALASDTENEKWLRAPSFEEAEECDSTQHVFAPKHPCNPPEFWKFMATTHVISESPFDHPEVKAARSSNPLPAGESAITMQARGTKKVARSAKKTKVAKKKVVVKVPEKKAIKKPRSKVHIIELVA